MEAIALPISEKGRRMLLLTHNEGGGSGCPCSLRVCNSASLK